MEIQPRKGVFVVRKSLGEILEMIVTWAGLESMAARLVTEVATDSTLSNLSKRNGPDSTRVDIEEYSDANTKFHQSILGMSGCRLLKLTTDRLFLRIHAMR